MTSRQQPYPYIIYHSPCADGFTAAYCAWTKFKDQARYIGLGYQDNVPELREGADLYLVDFTFKRHVLLDLAKKHPKIVILDHHITAQEALDGISEEAPNIEVHFDMEHSGAHLAWKYFQPDFPTVPALIMYVEDRDLYRNALPDSRAINAALYSYDISTPSFALWRWIDGRMEFDRNFIIQEGEAILRNQERQIAALLLEARAADFGEWEEDDGSVTDLIIPAVNAPYFLASDLGHRLLEKYPHAPFAAVYRDTADGRRDWSLRSENARLDVSEVAKTLGGGGHRNASGMSEAYAEQNVFFEIYSYDDYVGEEEILSQIRE